VASKYSIQAVFGLIDNITAPLDKVAGKGNAVGKALKNDFIQTDKAAQQLGKRVSKLAGDFAKAAAKFGAAALAAGAAAAGAFIVKGLKDAVGFEKGMEQVGARANLTTEQIKAMSGELLNLSNSTGTGIANLQEAQFQILESGISAADSVGFLNTAVKAAGGGFTDTSKVITGLSSVIKSYGLEAGAAAQISDQMMAAARAGGVSFEDMATKLEKVLPVAAKFGVSSDKLFAAVASLTAQGVPIADATKKIKSALEKDGAAGMFNLTNADAFNAALGQITNSAGSTEEAFDRIQKTTGEKWGTVLNKVKNTGIKLGETLMPVFNKVIDKLSVFADKFAAMDFEGFAKKVEAVVDRIFASLDFEKLANGIATFFSVLSTLFTIIVKVGGVLWNMRGIIIGIAAAWGIYKAAMLAATVIGPLIGMVKAVQALMAAQKGMNVVQAIFNVLLNANPIGLIITAIGLLIGLIITLAMNWDKVCAAMSRAWEWIKNLASIIWDGLCNAFWSLMEIINENQNKVLALITVFMGPFGFILSIVNELRNNWEMVVETFKTDGIIAGLKKLGGVILSAMIAPIQGFLELLSKIPGVGKLLGPAVNKLDTLRADLKGTDGNVEKNIATRPPARERAANPAPAANTATPAAANTAARPASASVTPSAVTQPGGAASLPTAPTRTASGGGSAAGTPAVRQATLLDLRSPASAGTETATRTPSAWSTQATTTAPGQTRTNTAVSPAGAVTRASTPQQGPVSVPVKYVFPEMVIPPELVKTITVPVEWGINADLIPTLDPIALPVEYGFSEMVIPPELFEAITIPVEWAFNADLTPALEPVILPVEYDFPEMVIPPDLIKTIMTPIKRAFNIAMPPAKTDKIVPPTRTINASAKEGITPPGPPMTQAEQIIYSRTEHYENVNITVSPDEGASARVTKKPKSPNVKVTVSGGV
jgi:hypothetical protein